MKKKFYYASFAVAAATIMGLSSCDSTNNDDPVPVVVSSGVYVINAGNVSSSIDGSLTYYNYSNGSTTQNAYQAVNGESLGGTVNDAVGYGTKLYIVGSDESTVFVADKSTLKNIAKIAITVDGKAATPRHAAVGNGKVYVSTYSGKVVAIDTLSYSITATYSCGSYSEGLACYGDYLLVADSDYGNGNSTVSTINLTSGTTTTIKPDSLKNCTDVKIFNGYVFLLDQGSYDANWNQSGEAIYVLGNNNSLTKLFSATEMTLDETHGVIFGFDAPYTNPATTPTYTYYNIYTGVMGSFVSGSEVLYPAKISCDPNADYVYITSYNLNSGYADYSGKGYCAVYDYNQNYKTKFDTGVGPGVVVPNSKTVYVTNGVE